MEGRGAGGESCEPCSVRIVSVISNAIGVCTRRDVTFIAEVDPPGGPVFWSVDAGGTPAGGAGTTFTTRFITPGTKMITATCTGPSGQTSSDSTSIQVIDPTIEVRVNGQRPQDFHDFLVGPGQADLRVVITTRPAAAQVEWTVHSINAESGTVLPGTGNGKMFLITPDVAAWRPTAGSSRAPNDPVGYSIRVEITSPGCEKEEMVRFEQDEISILRQEYVDYGCAVPARGDIGTEPVAGMNTGNYGVMVLGELVDRFNRIEANYRGRSVNVGGVSVPIPDNARVRVGSAYRNPQRNRAVGSRFNCSRHVLSQALDIVPTGPLRVTVGGVDFDLLVHDHLYPTLRDAGATEGAAICEDRPGDRVDCGDASEDHVHVQW